MTATKVIKRCHSYFCFKCTEIIHQKFIASHRIMWAHSCKLTLNEISANIYVCIYLYVKYFIYLVHLFGNGHIDKHLYGTMHPRTKILCLLLLYVYYYYIRGFSSQQSKLPVQRELLLHDLTQFWAQQKFVWFYSKPHFMRTPLIGHFHLVLHYLLDTLGWQPIIINVN